MARCTHCGNPTTLMDRGVCAECGFELLNEAEPDRKPHQNSALKPISRFTDAAEAGYFAHELYERVGIPGTLFAEDDFDAVSGAWETAYILAVPEALAELASAELIELIESNEDRETDTVATRERSRIVSRFGYDEPTTTPEPEWKGSAGVSWMPILLTVTTGTMVWWLSSVQNAPAPKPDLAKREQSQPLDPALWNELTRHSESWTQTTGKTVRELTFDRPESSVLVREDADGDGRFESVMRFELPQ